MSRSTKYLTAFRRALQQREELIKRGAYLTSLEFTPVQDLAFKVIAKWATGQFEKEYTFSEVFRYSGTRTPVPKTSTCMARRVLVQEILKERGV